MEFEITGGVYDMLPNETLSRIMDYNLRKVGGFTYTEKEIEFANEIQKSFANPPSLETTNQIGPFELLSGPASTDVGDVSYVVPTAGIYTATWVPGTAAHSWQAVAAGGTSIGEKGMLMAAKTIALSVIDVFLNQAVLEDAKKELSDRVGTDFTYEAMIGNRKPALDYRK
jgi:aminobenzoyl-glutamate utilization protein B